MGGYTPGPWSFDSMTHYVTDAETERTQIAHVLGLGMWGIWDEEAAANARLIASAPELLEAAETLLFELVTGGTDVRDAVIASARAAISRATGEGE